MRKVLITMDSGDKSTCFKGFVLMSLFSQKSVLDPRPPFSLGIYKTHPIPISIVTIPRSAFFWRTRSCKNKIFGTTIPLITPSPWWIFITRAPKNSRIWWVVLLIARWHCPPLCKDRINQDPENMTLYFPSSFPRGKGLQSVDGMQGDELHGWVNPQ